MKRLKLLLILVMLVTVTILSTSCISFVNHKIQLSNEDDLLQPIGERVEVNGNVMNVYSEGKGETTLVFMAGGGTSSPVLDFKSLYSRLSDTYRIVVVEKIGYGFSEIADIDRDIATILSETRHALFLAGIEGPFVLCPHSMSGIEALYWAQQYPQEVRAIIGLDMALPQAYENYKINMFMLTLASFGANVGFTRWFPSLAESDAIKYGTLTEEEKETYRMVFYRRTTTKTMRNEMQEIKKNAAIVAQNAVPSVPLLMFSSNGEGTGWNPEEWRAYQREYAETASKATLIELDCSHYVHDIEYVRIADEIKLYLEG